MSRDVNTSARYCNLNTRPHYPWCKGKQTALCPARCSTSSPWGTSPARSAAERWSSPPLRWSSCSCREHSKGLHRLGGRTGCFHPRTCTTWKHKNQNSHALKHRDIQKDFYEFAEMHKGPHGLEERSDWEPVCESATRAWVSRVSWEAEALFPSRT